GRAALARVARAGSLDFLGLSGDFTIAQIWGESGGDERAAATVRRGAPAARKRRARNCARTQKHSPRPCFPIGKFKNDECDVGNCPRGGKSRRLSQWLLVNLGG